LYITTYQLATKSNPNFNPNPNPTTNQHAVVNIQLNIMTCPAYPDKFVRDMLMCSNRHNAIALESRLSYMALKR